MSKTEALRIAQDAIGRVYRSGHSYCMSGPWKDRDISGPSTTVERSTYPEALRARCEWVASIAVGLVLPDADPLEIDAAVCWRDPAPTRDLVAQAIKQLS